MRGVRLGDYAELVRGITFKPSDKCKLDRAGAIACLRTKNVQKELDQSDLIAVPAKLVKSKEKMLSPGDILVSSANSWNLVGKCCLVRQLRYPSAAGGFISVLRPTSRELDSSYLYHWFSAERTQAHVRSFGNQTTNISNLNHKRTLNLRLPLPPLTEQKRIAKILDAADALRAKRRESIALLDELLRSTFLDMFGDPVANPKRWPIRQLSQLGDVQGGLQVTSKRKSLPLERPYLRVANVLRGRLRMDEVKKIRLTDAEERRTRLEEGDILIVEGHGNPEEIGRCARWDGSVDPCVHQNHLIRFRCDDHKVLPTYLEAYLNSNSGRRGLLRAARTTSGLNTISVSKVRAASVLVPPMELQLLYRRVVDQVAGQRALLAEHLAELDNLFASLQSRAFRGEL